MRKVDIILHERVDRNDVPAIQKMLGLEGDVLFAKDITEGLELAEGRKRDVIMALEKDACHFDLKYFFECAGENSARAMIYELNNESELYWPGEGLKKLGDEYLDGFKLVDIFYFSSQKRPFSKNLNNLIPIPKHKVSYLDIKKIPTLFLDRDGVINYDVAYLHKISDLKIYEEIIPIIKMANHNKINVVVLTNQAGVARGMFSEKDVCNLNVEIKKRLNEEGVHINEIYNCFYLESGKVDNYKKKSLLRKPMPGMLLQACYEFPVEISRSFMIGDKISDKFVMPGISTLLIQRNYEIPESERVYSTLGEILEVLQGEFF